MRPPILRRKPYQQHAQKQCHHLQWIEQQRQRLVRHPADKHQKGNDKERYLNAGANRDGEGEVDLVAVGDEDGGDVLGGVCLYMNARRLARNPRSVKTREGKTYHDRQKNKSDECLGNVVSVGGFFD